MGPDLRLRQQQRVLDRFELVSGIGEPDEGTACVMSLVAHLAGEGRTDRPRCASPLIREFAIPVNDRMPREARQRLKPFAPRLVGTNDGLDRARAEVLRRALVETILPRASGECQAASPGGPARRARARSGACGSGCSGATCCAASAGCWRKPKRAAGAAKRPSWRAPRGTCSPPARATPGMRARRSGTGTRPSGSWTGCATSARKGSAGKRRVFAAATPGGAAGGGPLNAPLGTGGDPGRPPWPSRGGAG